MPFKTNGTRTYYYEDLTSQLTVPINYFTTKEFDKKNIDYVNHKFMDFLFSKASREIIDIIITDNAVKSEQEKLTALAQIDEYNELFNSFKCIFNIIVKSRDNERHYQKDKNNQYANALNSN